MVRVLALFSLLGAMLLACSGETEPQATVSVIARATQPAAVLPTPTPEGGSPQPSSPTAPANPAPIPPLVLEPVFADLSFRNPTGLYTGPGGRFFLTEQSGRVLVFSEGSAASSFLDISDRVITSFEEGLLGFALSPDYAESGAFYVNYSAGSPRRTVVSRFEAGPGGSGPVDPAGEVIILEVEQPFATHNGGQIHFGADGYLYIALGDGGGGGDPQGNGQDLGTLLGTVLRIDVSVTDGYEIPPDNPFSGMSGQGVREEIWAYGLRNPWRFSFDSETGDLWLGDVGERSREEINIAAHGGNLGWSVMEGGECFRAESCDQEGLTLPVFDYAHGDGECAAIGGFVYRGGLIAGLVGAYIFGDHCSGRIWAFPTSGDPLSGNKLVATLDGRLSTFGVDDRGELFVVSYGPEGRIFRLVAEP